MKKRQVIQLGRYEYHAMPQMNYYFIHSLPEVKWSATGEIIKSYDHMLHQSLDKIFRERGLSISSQIEEFLRGPQLKSIIMPILDQESVLSTHFSKEKLEQLPLLWITVLGCYKQSAELLVRYGADVNEPFGRRDPQMIDEKWTVLHVLLQMNPSPENERLIRLIVDHGANLQARDCRRQTVLYYAMNMKRVQITEMLLEKGADVNLPGNLGTTPLFMVITGMPTMGKGNFGSTIHNEMVSLLLKYGANFQARDYRGRTVLHLAIERDQVQVTKMLLENGADVNAADNEGMTPLLHAFSKFKVDKMVPLLMKYGADFQARNHKGKTVLHYAVQGYSVQMTKMLLEKGADVNAADNEGNTPLHIAVDSSCQANKLVPLLIKHGANIFANNREGMNALHCLSNTLYSDIELARFLIEKGGSLDDRAGDELYQPIHSAAQIGSNELVELFLDKGANVNSLTKEGESPLYIAVKCGQARLVETLLQRGANVDLKTIHGHTPLHMACFRKVLPCGILLEESIIIRLLSAGADVLAEDNNRRTPLAFFVSTGLAEPGQEFWPLIEVLALKKALQPWINLKDLDIIKPNPTLHYHYQKCFKEIESMKCTRFIESCSIFELLVKSQCQIAALMRNREFESKFRVYDLNDVFPIYARDILRAFNGAKQHYHSRLQQAKMIDEAVYNILPYLVVQKVVYYLFDCCRNVK